MPPTAELLPGTLDLLILKAVSLGPLHGYGVLLRIGQISGDALQIEQGALYPALYRLERQELLSTEWGVSENNRRAKYYQLTAAGRRRLRDETAGWERLVAAMGAALATRRGEVYPCSGLYAPPCVQSLAAAVGSAIWTRNCARTSSIAPRT